MKVINTRLHGILDYASAFVLLLPWFSGYYTGGPDTRILAAVGGITILISLCTDYEFGLVKLLPMKAHLVLDVLVALFLIAMPWLFPVYHMFFTGRWSLAQPGCSSCCCPHQCPIASPPGTLTSHSPEGSSYEQGKSGGL